MALAISEVRGIVERVCARQDVLDACAKHDLGAVIAILNAHGLTQGELAALTGISQGRLSEYKTGKRTPKGHSLLRSSPTDWGCCQRHARRWGLRPVNRL